MMNRREFLRGVFAVTAAIALAPIVVSKAAAKEVVERWRPLSDQEKEDIICDALESDEGVEYMANAMLEDNPPYVIRGHSKVPQHIIEGKEVFIPAYRRPRIWQRDYWYSSRITVRGKRRV